MQELVDEDKRDGGDGGDGDHDDDAEGLGDGESSGQTSSTASEQGESSPDSACVQADDATQSPERRQTRHSGLSSSLEGRDLLIRRGAQAFAATHGPAPPNAHGPTLRDGRVVIRQSERGGVRGRGLFVGCGGGKQSEPILYGGEVISGTEAKAREARHEGDYLLQLNYRDDADRVDGKPFADAISSEPDADGYYGVLEEWARDAGPGCIVNEDTKAPNAKFDVEYLDKDKLLPYRVIRLLRDLEEGEEILVKYNRKGTVGDGGDDGLEVCDGAHYDVLEVDLRELQQAQPTKQVR